MTHPQQGGRPRPGDVPTYWPQHNVLRPGPYPQQPYQRPRRPSPTTPPQVSPVMHGADGDPRHPSPRKLRRALGFTVDLLLHFGLGVGAFFGTQHIPALDNLIGLWALLGWIGASLIDRVLIQWVFCTTVGKAIFALRLIRKDGGRPRLTQLIIAWLVGLGYVVEFANVFGSGPGLDIDGARYFLPAVRMKDVRMLRSGSWPGLTVP